MDGRELLMQTTFAQAATFMNDGRYEEALKLLEKLLEDGWDDSELLTMTLACALYLERWELSDRLVKELEKNAIDEPEALLLMLDYALAQEDRKKGKFLLDQIKEKHPEWTWLLWDVAELLSDYGWAEEYESMLKLLTQIPSKDPWSRLDQAEAWMTLEEPAEAASAAYQAAEGLDVEHKDDLLFAAHLLEEAREKAYIIRKRKPAADHIVFPEKKLTYLGNVTNEKAVEFYNQYGVEEVMHGFEVKADLDVPLMFCKHCIKYSLGWCPKEGYKATFKEPLYITYKDQQFQLDFDCRKCEMMVMKRRN